MPRTFTVLLVGPMKATSGALVCSMHNTACPLPYKHFMGSTFRNAREIASPRCDFHHRLLVLLGQKL